MHSASSPRPSKYFRHFSRSLFLSLILVIFSCVGVQAETYKVTRVYDGDTITVLMDGKKQSIRLVGIDTPEKFRNKGEPGQPFSQKATNLKSNRKLFWLLNKVDNATMWYKI